MKERNFSILRAILDIADKRGESNVLSQVNELGREQFKRAGVTPAGQIAIPLFDSDSKRGRETSVTLSKTEIRGTISSLTSGSGKEWLPTEIVGFIDSLKTDLSLVDFGAHFLANCIGNVSIPKYSGSTIGWVSETGEAPDAAGATSSVDLTPKRLSGYIDFSRSFLNQVAGNPDVERSIINDMVEMVAEAIYKALFGAQLSNAPDSFFKDIVNVSDLDYSGNVTLQSVVSAKGTLLKGDPSKLGWVIHPEVWYKFATTSVIPNTASFIYDKNGVLGVKTAVFADMWNITSGSDKYCGAVLGDWSKFVIAQWGGLDLIIDPYSQAINGKVRVVLNAYFDAKVTHPECFVKCGFKI